VRLSLLRRTAWSTVSGILAVVTYGLYQGWRAPRLFPDASTWLQALAFWGVLVFLLEALLFLLVGQQLPSILGGIEEYSMWHSSSSPRSSMR
jgi:NhaP-type Na+/H+ or K+/H+ antiporter